MPARLLLAHFLLFMPCVALLQGCAARPAAVAVEPQRDSASADSAFADSASAAQPGRQPFQSSAPGEIVPERVKIARSRAVEDMLRTDLVATVEQGPLGILRVGVGEKFHTHQARDFYFAKLALVYHGWTVESQPLIVELWERGRKIGEYTERAFLIGPRYTTPRDCPEAAPTGLCALALQPQAPPGTPASAAAQPEPTANAREGSGFHFGLGLGGGAKDFACDGCDFASETGLSGFLAVARSVRETTLVGIEGTGWTKSQSGRTARVYSLTAQVTQYWSQTSGLFLGAGLGLVGYHENRDSGDRSANALGFSGRLGYEIGTGAVAFVPYVGIVRTFGGADMKVDGRNEGLNVAISNVHFGLSVAAH